MEDTLESDLHRKHGSLFESILTCQARNDNALTSASDVPEKLTFSSKI